MLRFAHEHPGEVYSLTQSNLLAVVALFVEVVALLLLDHQSKDGGLVPDPDDDFRFTSVSEGHLRAVANGHDKMSVTDQAAQKAFKKCCPHDTLRHDQASRC